MDILSSKLELVKIIVDSNDEVLITKILNLLKGSDRDFWMDFTEEEKQEIETGTAQLNAGERISLDDFLKKVS